jgi:hypothetical protein
MMTLFSDSCININSQSNRTSTSSFQHILEASYTGGVPAVGNETLPSTLAIFDSTEFLNLQGMNWTGTSILHVWKNMICVMGNINAIQVSTD